MAGFTLMMDDERPVPRNRKPGIGVDPSKLDMTPHIREGVPMPPATEEDIMRYKFLMGPNSPLASSSVSPTGSSNLQVAMDSMRPNSFLHTYMADNNLVSSLDPQGELLLRALQKGEIGDPNSPRIKKAIEDLQREKYGAGGRAQNQEVMGPVEQEFARFADPEDGTLVAADPIDKAAYGPAMTRSQFSDYNELRSPGYKDRRDALRMRLMNAGILPRV
jgi:hypothetical protein